MSLHKPSNSIGTFFRVEAISALALSLAVTTMWAIGGVGCGPHPLVVIVVIVVPIGCAGGVAVYVLARRKQLKWVTPILYTVLLGCGLLMEYLPLSWRLSESLDLGVVMTGFVVAALVARRFLPDAPIVKSGACSKCDYNLTGNVSGVCPECGVDVQAV